MVSASPSETVMILLEAPLRLVAALTLARALAVVKAADPFSRLIHRLADEARPDLQRAIARAIAKVRDGIVTSRVEEAIAAHDVGAALRAIPWEKLGEVELREGLGPLIDELATTSSEASARVLRRQGFVEGAIEFNVVNPRVLEAARTITATLVREVSTETQAAIRETLEGTIAASMRAREAATFIRPLIGLTGRQAQAVQTLHVKQLEAGIEPARADRLAAQYADRLHHQRAELIAHTEAMRAANAGQQATWEALRDAGQLGQDLEQEWITSRDRRVDPICEALDRTRAAIGGMFPGGLTRPPAHPACRCTTGIIESRGR